MLCLGPGLGDRMWKTNQNTCFTLPTLGTCNVENSEFNKQRAKRMSKLLQLFVHEGVCFLKHINLGMVLILVYENTACPRGTFSLKNLKLCTSTVKVGCVFTECSKCLQNHTADAIAFCGGQCLLLCYGAIWCYATIF